MAPDDPVSTLHTDTSTSRRQGALAPGGRLCLVVIGEGLDATYPLPDSGNVMIGRAPDADILIDHPSVSRHHAELTIGDPLVLRDMGSANGTRIRDRWLSQQRSEVALGEPFDVGSVMVVVQQRSAPAQKRHIWAHGYFEARVEEELARMQRSNGMFAVLRIHCSEPDTRRVVETVLCRELRAMDVIGYYGPSEHEVLVVDTRPEDVDVISTKLTSALASSGVQSRIGVAIYPNDARNPYELLSRASAAALGQEVEQTSAGPPLPNIAIQNLDKIVQRIAIGGISVLITGETGVGKEVLAERIHRLSRRADKPFLRLNCAALSESLLESELFGHEKGAFTGAVTMKEGLLETADGGTVFLDEIGELPMSIQVKLLRVIEERSVMRVGALRARRIDVRFLAATHRDLEHEITRGSFRQDLYFRLNGITLVIPPLRDRVSEIPELAAAFLRQTAERDGIGPAPTVSRAAMGVLCDYAWPGNIRELRNVMERALLLSGGGTIEIDHLPLEKMRVTGSSLPAAPARPPRAYHPRPAAGIPPTRTATSAAPPPTLASIRIPTDAELEAPLETITDERARVVEALARAGGNQQKAAKLLGYSRRTLINRMEQFQIPRPRKA